VTILFGAPLLLPCGRSYDIINDYHLPRTTFVLSQIPAPSMDHVR